MIRKSKELEVPLSVEDDVEHIADLFWRVARVLKGPKSPIKSIAFSLTLAQSRCLWAIAKREDCTLRELGEQLGIRPSTASELVDRLVQAGLVQRETDPNDRRNLQLRLAAKGRQLFERHRHERQAHIRQLLECLSAEQRAAMVNALETLN